VTASVIPIRRPTALSSRPTTGPLFATADEFVTAVFGPAGYLAKHFKGYSPRPGQVALARAIYETLDRGLVPATETAEGTVVAAHRLLKKAEQAGEDDDLPPDFKDPYETARLVCEGPTGVGKSLAYGIPATYFAWRRNFKVVIATANNALLQQLIGKDMPLIAKLVPWPVKVSALVGKGQYACLHKIRGEMGQGEDGQQAIPDILTDLDPQDKPHVDRLMAWVKQTSTGYLGEMSPELPESVRWRAATSSEDCLRDGCASYNDCFARQAKADAEGADVIVTNYALLFRHVAMRMLWGVDVVLPPHRGLILDEFHEAEGYARSGFGASVGPGTFRHVARWADKHAKQTNLDQTTQKTAARLGKTLTENARDLFGWVGRHAAGPHYKVRLTDPAWLTPAAPDTVVGPARDIAGLARREESALTEELETYTESEMHPDTRVTRRFKRAIAEAKNARVRAERAAGWLREVSTLADGMEARALKIKELVAAGTASADAVKQVGGDPGNGKVYWVKTEEKMGRKGPETRVSIEAQPLRIGGLLHSQVWTHKSLGAIVAVSATLRTTAVVDAREGVREGPVDQDAGWSHARDHLGIPVGTRAVAVASPFDFQQQARLVIPYGVPSPKAPSGVTGSAREGVEKAYDAACAKVVVDVVKAVGGGVLGLFTSKRAMGVARDALQSEQTGFNVFVQGQMGRGELVRRFREDRDSVALGVASLGTGVDVPGDALRAVVINKLTFGMPEDPISHALTVYWEARQERAFDKETLPTMLLVLRQWVGRLVRDVGDVGFVVLCDPRAATGTYARKVQQAIGWPVVRDVGEAARWLKR
jgi:ATP-dependent DNA helicase DinG